MRTIRYTLIQRWPSGHYSPHSNVVVSYRGRSYELESGHGSRDDLAVYREGRTVYIVNVNRGIPYCGVAVYTLDAASERDRALISDGEVYAQGDEVAHCLGPNGLRLAMHTIARRLAPRCYGY